MCGIGGFVDYERDARRGGPILHGMKRTLTPRGPDAEGTYFDEDAALVHRRLIVIDPEGGKQPMHSPDRNTIIIYNGELYNTPELRTELMSRGHEFVGHSDTEVLLHAYLEWKTDAFSRLNGIFAFAIWEKRERRLTLCRDRLGVKPLFFAPIRNGLTFGSTIDTVLCHPEIEPALDEDGLRTLLLLGPARPPESGVFRQISSLVPGHFAVLTPESFTDHTYWRLEAHEHEDDLPTTIERTHTLICDAARRQLVSDVPLACFLSGGLDSSILSMLAAKDYAARGETLHTWSVDYRDNDKYFTKSIFQPNSDDSYIDQMVDFLGTHHHRVVLEPEALCAALLPATDARALPAWRMWTPPCCCSVRPLSAAEPPFACPASALTSYSAAIRGTTVRKFCLKIRSRGHGRSVCGWVCSHRMPYETARNLCASTTATPAPAHPGCRPITKKQPGCVKCSCSISTGSWRPCSTARTV